MTVEYIKPRVSWPRPATPCDLEPAWAGEFRDFNDWVNKATTRLTGTYDPKMGVELPAVCIDSLGRRCTMGSHFMRARDEDAFPVRFFWDMRPAEALRDDLIEQCAVAAEMQDRTGYEWVRDSIWENILKRAGVAVRALKGQPA